MFPDPPNCHYSSLVLRHPSSPCLTCLGKTGMRATRKIIISGCCRGGEVSIGAFVRSSIFDFQNYVLVIPNRHHVSYTLCSLDLPQFRVSAANRFDLLDPVTCTVNNLCPGLAYGVGGELLSYLTSLGLQQCFFLKWWYEVTKNEKYMCI